MGLVLEQILHEAVQFVQPFFRRRVLRPRLAPAAQRQRHKKKENPFHGWTIGSPPHPRKTERSSCRNREQPNQIMAPLRITFHASRCKLNADPGPADIFSFTPTQTL